MSVTVKAHFQAPGPARVSCNLLLRQMNCILPHDDVVGKFNLELIRIPFIGITHL